MQINELMIKQLIYRFLFFAFGLAVTSLLGACSKEDAPPKLTVLSPQSNDFVATNSELEIKVRCSDDIALKKLTVFIKNEELSQIFTSVSHLFNDEKEA